MIHKNQIVLFLGVIILGVGLVGCSAKTGATTTSTEANALPVVTDGGMFHAEGKVVPQQYTTLSFQTGGEIGEIFVKEEQTAAKGAPLASLANIESFTAGVSSAGSAVVDAQKLVDDLNKKAELDKGTALQTWHDTETEMIETRQALNEMDTKEYNDKLDDLEEDVQDAKDDLDDAQEDLDKYLNLDPTSDKRKNAQEDYDEEEEQYLDAVYKRDLKINDLDVAKANYDAAVAKAADAKREYEQKQKGPDTELLKQAQAGLAAAKAQLESSKSALVNAQIEAPYAGTVVDLFHNTPGEFVNPGQSVVEMADFSAWYVETKDLTELDVVKVKIGDEVELAADALPGVVMKGTVDSIKQVYGEYSGDIVYTIRIKIIDPSAQLRWGMTVDAKFTPTEEK
jgi:multidrug efflux pump subunit AcrA (membrane-fusion protein)